MRSAVPHWAAASICATAFAPTAAFAHGDLSGLAIVIPSILVLHIASIAAAVFLQRKRRSWPFMTIAGLAAIVTSIMWSFGGYLQFANYPLTARQDVWLWVWLFAPMVLIMLAIAIFVRLKHSIWSFIAVAILAAAATSIMWFFGFLQLEIYVPAARQGIWLWLWFLAPFVLFVLSAASALYQRYSGRAA